MSCGHDKTAALMNSAAVVDKSKPVNILAQREKRFLSPAPIEESWTVDGF